MTIGIGIGIDKFPWAASGGGGGSPSVDPSALDSLVIWITGGDEYWNVEPASDPKQGINPINRAEGGSALSEQTSLRRAYLFDDDWSPSTPGVYSDPIPAPGGAPWFGASSSNLDSTRTDYSMDQNLDTPPDATGEVSGILTFFMHPQYTTAEDIRLVSYGNLTHYLEIDGDGTIDLYDSTNGHTYPRGTSPEANVWEDAWHIMSWGWNFGAGFWLAVDGVQIDTAVDLTGQTATGSLTMLWDSYWRARFMADFIVYNEAHSLEELNTVASVIAAARGIDYTYTPLPPE